MDFLVGAIGGGEAGDVGVGGADLPRVPFSAEWRGGLGARVEDECRGLVNSRDTLAVVVDASATGTTGGGLRNAGFASSFSFCFSCSLSFWLRISSELDSFEVERITFGGVRLDEMESRRGLWGVAGRTDSERKSEAAGVWDRTDGVADLCEKPEVGATEAERV